MLVWDSKAVLLPFEPNSAALARRHAMNCITVNFQTNNL